MFALLQDLRYSVRSLRKSPGFVALAVFTLTLGVGATSSMFSLVNEVLYRPLPVRDADRLVRLSDKRPDSPYFAQVSQPNFRDLKEAVTTLEDLVGSGPVSPGVATDEFSIKATGVAVTGDYFHALGVDPLLGRLIRPEEDGPPGTHFVVVLGHRFWRTRFGGDPAVVGTTIQLNKQPFEIVGVLPEEFTGIEWAMDPQLYVPIAMQEGLGNNDRERRGNSNFRALARLAPGVSLEAAQAEVDSIVQALNAEHPGPNLGMRIHLIPETRTRPDPSIHEISPIISSVFLGLVALVMLIACANLANLMLSRGLDRQREIAIRRSLGAGRARVARQLFLESLLIAALGGAGALAVAAFSSEVLSNVRVATDLPIYFRFSVDWRVFAFNAAVVLLSVTLFGLFPALRASNPDLLAQIKDGGRSNTASRSARYARSGLLVAQFGVSLVLLVVAGLFVRSLQAAAGIYLGFEPAGRLMATVSPAVVGYNSDETTAILERTLEVARELPGVRSAALSYHVPFGFSASGFQLCPEGRPPAEGERMTNVGSTVVSPGYFETMGTPLLAGRDFTENDDSESDLAAVVNQKLANLFWPGEDPLGKRLSTNREGTAPWITVVGVVPTGKYQLLSEAPGPYLFMPWKQKLSLRDAHQPRGGRRPRGAGRPFARRRARNRSGDSGLRRAYLRGPRLER